jgi:cytochrome c-type biogenesis protein CcmH/NrfF
MRPRALLAALAIAVLAAGAIPAVAPGAAPQVRLTDIEDEVMCPICGTLLELAESPQAQRERAFVTRLVAAGKTRAEIKDALVAQYGNDVLALPQGTGFNLSAYLVPIVAFILAAAALAAAVWRWRGRGGNGSRPSSPSPPSSEDADRLDADIARYDL